MARNRGKSAPRRRPTKKGATAVKKSCKQRRATIKRCKKKKNKHDHIYRLFVSHVAKTTKSSGLALWGRDLITQAAKCWNSLTDEQKKHFEGSTKARGSSSCVYKSFP